MDINLLNVRIKISKNTVIIDEIGNHKNEWLPFYSCYATVSSEAGKESTDAGMIIDDSKIDFTIRWCNKVSLLDSTQYRVEFNNDIYDIKAIDHKNYKRKCIKISCQKVRQ